MQRLHFFKDYICEYGRKCVNPFGADLVFDKCRLPL